VGVIDYRAKRSLLGWNFAALTPGPDAVKEPTGRKTAQQTFSLI
jgi:hypothetical protein